MSNHLPRDCETLREHLPAYAEGSLGGRARGRVERHLGSCQRCADELADLRTVIGAVRAIPAEQTPDDLVARVRQAVHDRTPAPAPPPLLWARLAVPAAVLTGAVAIALALRTPPVRQLELGAAAPSTPSRTVGGAQSGGRARGTRPGGPAKLSDEAPLFDRADAREEGWAAAREPTGMLAEEKPGAAADRPSLSAPRAAGRAAEQEAPSAPREPTMRDHPRYPHLSAPSSPGRRGGGAGAGGVSGSAQAKERAAPDARPEEEARLDAIAEAPSAPLSATVALASAEGGKMVALRLTSQRPLEEVRLALGDAAPRALSWQGTSGGPAWIPLSVEDIGPGPAAIPIRVEAPVGARDYVLFVPVLARLGESAPSAPTARYRRAPFRNVLADFSALTGLVVLAEPPLDMEFSGELAAGEPGAALEQLAGQLGFDSHREGDLAYTLTHTR